MDDEIRTKLSLDGIITPVDARHVVGHIDDFDEVRWQIAFADVTLRSKTARVSPTDLNSLESRIRAMNAAARFYRTKDAAVELDRILNLGGFDLQRALEVDPAFMEPEYPFAWTGLYAVAAGTYFVTLNRGPDPSLNLTFLEAKEHTSEAMWQTVQQAALAFFGAKIFVPPRNAISSHTEFVQLRLDTAPIRFPVTIPNRGVWVFFTEHHPDEFFAVLQHIDVRRPPPPSAHANTSRTTYTTPRSPVSESTHPGNSTCDYSDTAQQTAHRKRPGHFSYEGHFKFSPHE